MSKRLTDLSPYYKSTSDGYIRLTYEQVIIGLQNRVNKAIDYIEEHCKTNPHLSALLVGSEIVELLDILKGVDKE